jgi:hypothetical protein
LSLASSHRFLYQSAEGRIPPRKLYGKTGVSMKLYWKIFWLVLGILELVLIGGCVVSAYLKSAGIFYQAMRLAFTVGSGVCGLVALIALPIELYFEGKMWRHL